MAARFVEPVFRAQSERISGFVDETLVALDVDLDVPVTVLPRHATKAQPNVLAWGNHRGVYIPTDVLDLPDDQLRATTVEETAHCFLHRAHPRVAQSELHAEMFSRWVVAHVTRGAWTPLHMPAKPDPYTLGIYAAAALAGSDEARDELKAAGAGGVLRMVGRLEEKLGDDPDPQTLAGLLVAELGGR